MAIIMEDSEEIGCSHCAQLKQTFVVIAVSSLFVMIVVSGVLLVVVSGRKDSEVENITGLLVDFVLGLLYVQLFIAASLLVINILKKKHSTLKFHVWYVVFHVTTMSLFLVLSLGMTLATGLYALFLIVVVASLIYFSILYFFFKAKNTPWKLFRSS